MNPTAHSSQPAVADAVAEVKSRLGPIAPRLVLYFASPSYAPAELASAMERAFAPTPTMGCTTAGEIVSGALLKRSLVAMAFSPEVVGEVAVVVVPALRAGRDGVPAAFEALGAKLGASMKELDATRYAGLVLVDGLSGAEERLMESIGNLTDVLFVGGSAGDDLAFRATHVFARGEAHHDAAVLAVLRLDRGFSILKTQSFATTGKRLRATKVREADRTVLEFDGQPAPAAYAAALGVPAEKLAEEFMSHPVGLMAGEEPFVRSPQQVQGDGLRFYCAIREGMDLDVLESRDIVDATRRALDRKRMELGGISGIVNFNCILRTLELEKKGEAQAYGGLFAEVPTVGFSTYGEEYLGHVNQTATMLVMR